LWIGYFYTSGVIKRNKKSLGIRDVLWLTPIFNSGIPSDLNVKIKYKREINKNAQGKMSDIY